ncbi:MAG: hypothetical protein HQK51_05930 [Oligoflexia bacterium]|nr:hypothetical protein [Oligoflexia bacterium]
MKIKVLYIFFLLFFALAREGFTCTEGDKKQPQSQPKASSQLTSVCSGLADKLKSTKYELVSLSSEYVGEEQGKSRMKEFFVQYLKEDELLPYRVFITSEGSFVNYQKRKWDTVAGASLLGEAMYVLRDNGDIIVSNRIQEGRFHHSSLGGGKPVACAGTIRIENGKLTLVTNESGHYKPGRKQLDQMIERLRELGVNTKGVRVRLIERGKHIETSLKK